MLTAGTMPGHILFIGNSYTLFNGGIDVHVRGLAAASGTGDTCAVVRRIQGGATLSSHWHTYASQNAIDSSFDAVVLQGYLQHRVSVDSFRAAVRLFCAYAESAGVRPVLLANWANPFGTGDMNNGDIAYEYETAGAAAGAGVVHAGAAFDVYAAGNPDEDLLCDNIAHPTPAGTYLAAACVYAFFADESPAGIDYDGGLPAEPDWQRTYLQELAWYTVGGGPMPTAGVPECGVEVPRVRVYAHGWTVHAVADHPGCCLEAFDADGDRLMPLGRRHDGTAVWNCPRIPGIRCVVVRPATGAVQVLPVFVSGPMYW